MDGRTLKAGAVAGVTIIKNPITAARAVMEKSPHVLLAGRGAELFATSVGIEIVDPSYFWTERRWKQLQKKLMEGGAPSVELVPGQEPVDEKKFGTVGAVALDSSGNLAVGTSTGGMTDKRFGRIGDTPIIGAGTYANNRTCGVSGTGHGEYFMRYMVAHEISALMEYKGMSVGDAADKVVMKTLKDAGGQGESLQWMPPGTSQCRSIPRVCIAATYERTEWRMFSSTVTRSSGYRKLMCRIAGAWVPAERFLHS